MKPQKVQAYGGLLNVTKKQYLSIQAVVFLVLAVVFISTFLFDLGDWLWGNPRLIIGIIAALEIVEMVYVLRKFRAYR